MIGRKGTTAAGCQWTARGDSPPVTENEKNRTEVKREISGQGEQIVLLALSTKNIYSVTSKKNGSSVISAFEVRRVLCFTRFSKYNAYVMCQPAFKQAYLTVFWQIEMVD